MVTKIMNWLDERLGLRAIYNLTLDRKVPKVNGWEKTVYSYGVYVYRKNETEVMVFSNVCTHLACRVTFYDDTREYDCPCHDAQFDIEGNIIAGPQPRPMDRYETKVEEGQLSIRLLEG